MNVAWPKPLVYSCSGRSSAAPRSNAVALKLDRANVTEMSCIAGIGGDVPPLLRTAKSGRLVVALDGCAPACVRNLRARHGIEPTLHLLLSAPGVRKRHHVDFDPVQAQRVFRSVSQQIARALSGRSGQVPALMQPRIAQGACS